MTTDSTILDVGDVELVDLKFVEGDPVVVVQFTCQQINCSRDRFGNVVEGGPQDVQRVYYFWALQQEDAGKFSVHLPALDGRVSSRIVYTFHARGFRCSFASTSGEWFGVLPGR